MRAREQSDIEKDGEFAIETLRRQSGKSAMVVTVGALDASGQETVDTFNVRKNDSEQLEKATELITRYLDDERVSTVHVKECIRGQVRMDKKIAKYTQDAVLPPEAVPGEAEPRKANNETVGDMLFGLMGIDTADPHFNATQALMGFAVRHNTEQIQHKFERESEQTRQHYADEKRELELRHERENHARELAEANARVTQLTGEVERLKKENEKLDKENEKLDDTCERLEEEVKAREKLRPENSIMGVSLSGLLGVVGQNLLRRNAGFLGGLAGIDPQMATELYAKSEAANAAAVAAEMQGAAAAGSAPESAAATAAQAPEPAVEVVKEDARQLLLDDVNKWLRAMGDDEFQQVYNSIENYARGIATGTPAGSAEVAEPEIPPAE